ncbi:MAG: hypothetical protein M0P57_02745 [Syntrophales bacterium]|nr:hypothetical protein [Syntrophales bacterium]MDY0044794.1 hypothetical protein [Syntrophales bacterium]
MDTEFHYYITGIAAHAAGFTEDEARTVATASEFVDENDIAFSIEDRLRGEVYEVYISQTMNILKPKRTLMRIYPVFHFMPGDPLCEEACRRDGKMHLLNTTPDNERANELMDRAFKSPEDIRLHRIGIASHTFADTWAHQNFVGWYDYFNHMGFDPKPDIGHADGEHHPDWAAHRWQDSRLVEEDIDNRDRFLQAARRLYDRYRAYNKIEGREANLPWETLEESLVTAMGKSVSGPFNSGREMRLEAYRTLAPWLGDFDRDRWFDEAVDRKIRGLKDSKNELASRFFVIKDRYFWKDGVDREKTDWFRFQEAVKSHQRIGMELLQPLFTKMHIDLHLV